MIELTHSDVRTYCIGVAQLIPVFLIALSVLDNNRINRAAEKIKRESSTAEKAGQKQLSLQRKNRRKLQRSLEKIDIQIAAIDRIDPSQAGEEALVAREVTRMELMDLRAEIAELSGDAAAIGDKITEFVAKAPELRQQIDTASRKLMSGNAKIIVYGIFLGVVGEVMALWGAIGLMSSLLAIAWITDISIVVIGLLSLFAFDRLMEQSRSRLSRFIQAAWFIALLCVGQITFILILIFVKVVH
jgi:hypothetical protein